MSDSRPTPVDDPRAVLARLAGGYSEAAALHLATVLGIPDLLANGPRSASELAAETQTHPRSLERVLRWLAALGALRWDAGRFGRTPVSDLLRRDADGPARAHVLFVGSRYIRQAWDQLEHAVRTGESAFRRAHGVGQYDYYASHPEEGDVFGQMLRALRPGRHDQVARRADFSAARTVVDVGGGYGQALVSILRAHPHLRGVLFDAEAIIGEARDRIASEGLAVRITCTAGDFFRAVPPGGDVYVLGDILHNWDDTDSARILRVCRQAMHDASRLLVVEDLMPEGDVPLPLASMDAMMLVMYGEGRQRGELEFRELFEQTGLRMTRFDPDSTAGIVEARPIG